jgi:plasmid stability protein
MSNLTLSVDEQLIKRARVRAIEQGTSLSAKVREFLQEYVNESQAGLAKQRAEATARLMTAMDVATSKTPRAAEHAPATRRPRRTLREELYAADIRARDRKTTKAGASGKTRPAR